LDEGDEVLTTTHDFYSTHEALRLRAEQTGATVDQVSLYDDPSRASADELVGRLIDRITPRTRAVAVTWVHSGTGVKLPVAELGEAIADANGTRRARDRILLCVDAVHALGVELETPAELRCDVLVSGTQKWLFGPRGTGIVWVSPEALERLQPVIPPFEADSFTAWLDRAQPPRARDASRLTPGGYHSLEHRWALAEAFGFHDEMGKANVRTHTREQATTFKEAVADLDGVHVATPMSPELSSGIVCIEIDGVQPFGVLAGLLERGFSTGITPYRNNYLRIGPSIVTTPDETEALVEAIADLA